MKYKIYIFVYIVLISKHFLFTQRFVVSFACVVSNPRGPCTMCRADSSRQSIELRVSSRSKSFHVCQAAAGSQDVSGCQWCPKVPSENYWQCPHEILAFGVLQSSKLAQVPKSVGFIAMKCSVKCVLCLYHERNPNFHNQMNEMPLTARVILQRVRKLAKRSSDFNQNLQVVWILFRCRAMGTLENAQGMPFQSPLRD